MRYPMKEKFIMNELLHVRKHLVQFLTIIAL